MGLFFQLHAQDTGYGITPGSPPPALVCRIAKSSALAESILKKESHALQFDKIGLDFLAPDQKIHAREG
ncbi:MAG: hypothetical protein JRI94_03505 [Deltaproteobacteria bacterium]|nr:hypothetical protein [Deltaproteobacteria bacterium]